MGWDSATYFTTLLLRNREGDSLEFEVRAEGGSDGERECWIYLARPPAATLAEDEDYLLTMVGIAPGLFQVDGMKNRLPERFRGFRITQALIPEIARALQTRIRSSRHKPRDGETRTPDATRVWKGLEAEGLATYDAEEDRYCHSPNPHAEP